MDPRIGILIRNGETVYYAFAHGYDEPAAEGNLEQVEISLGLRPKAKRPGQFRTYTVTLTWHGQFLDDDEEITVRARTNAEAISKAREWKAMNYGRTRSCNLAPCTYRARLEADA